MGQYASQEEPHANQEEPPNSLPEKDNHSDGSESSTDSPGFVNISRETTAPSPHSLPLSSSVPTSRPKPIPHQRRRSKRSLPKFCPPSLSPHATSDPIPIPTSTSLPPPILHTPPMHTPTPYTPSPYRSSLSYSPEYGGFGCTPEPDYTACGGDCGYCGNCDY
jgi:hypothetical protein